MPISVNVPGVVFIISVPFEPIIAEYHTSPSLVAPSQVAFGTDEFVAPEFVPLTREQVGPTVNKVAVHGLSP